MLALTFHMLKTLSITFFQRRFFFLEGGASQAGGALSCFDDHAGPPIIWVRQISSTAGSADDHGSSSIFTGCPAARDSLAALTMTTGILPSRPVTAGSLSSRTD